jgi:hypothetical protein
VLAGVKPIAALRAGMVRAGSSVFRTLVIGVQFVLASFLLIAVVVMALQNWSLRKTALGIDEDPIVAISTRPSDAKVDSETFRTRLAASPDIKLVTGAGRRPWEQTVGGTGYSRTPDNLGSFQFTQTQDIWYDYFEALRMKVLAGRGFSRDFAEPPGAPPHVIIDRLAAEQFGWTNPADAIGQTIYQTPFGGKASPSEIVGVVEHAPRGLIGWGARSFVYILNDRDMGYPLIQVSRGNARRARAHRLGLAKPRARDPLEARVRGRDVRQVASHVRQREPRVHRARVVRVRDRGDGPARHGALHHHAAPSRGRRAQGARRDVEADLHAAALGLPAARGRRELLAWPLCIMAARTYLDVFMKPVPLTPARVRRASR